MDDRIFSIDGWMSETELNWLHDQARAIPDNSTIVEVGVWLGRSSAAIYTGAGIQKTTIAIDTWAGQPSLQATDHILASEVNLKELFLDNMHDLGIYPKSHKPGGRAFRNGFFYLTADSIQASKYFPDASIAMCFLDGDHDILDIDIAAWLPKMIPGGLLCGHDYSIDAPQIMKAVISLVGVPETADSIWYVRLAA